MCNKFTCTYNTTIEELLYIPHKHDVQVISSHQSIVLAYMCICMHTPHHQNTEVCQVITLTVNGGVCFHGDIAPTGIPATILICED